MGLGIAYVAAVHAKTPRIVIHDRSEAQIKKSLALMDKLLAKDVGKGKMMESDAKSVRERVEVVDFKRFRDVDMVIEVRLELPTRKVDWYANKWLQAASENLGLKTSLFQALVKEVRPDTVLASNTSSISITKLASAAIPEGQSAASEEGKKSASRVVGIRMVSFLHTEN